ncbi:hypothetical protein [Salibaculum griseiflavum]|uniref:Uncharacterized protein n=1 Tax=Salibaculum griseiflavum TaxID=1914409 RepID=A0A2V1P7W6_9RHOB|nr:hypothetical protein [Salibaculum griseiflavum]PWG17457.1 hypothetical protein DFK10_06740 [Salibaculum griseiflavum]
MADDIMTMAANLADDVIEIQDATGEDRLFVEVGDVIGAASQTLEEAFLTQVRIRLAERKARAFLKDRLQQIESELKAKQGG